MERKEIVFLTVGTKEQKQICEKIIAESNDFISPRVIIIADEQSGYRNGSGGAILNLISQHYEEGCKMAVINAGGKSKRCINYAVRSKAFANVEINGETVTLFELLYNNIRKLMNCFDAGLLICCSDILFDVHDLSENFSENIGFCIKSDIYTATRHGVMFHNDEMMLTEYPHKCSPDKLNELRFKYNTDDFLIDTGTVFFKEDLCLALNKAVDDFNIIKKLNDNRIELNLYSDIYPLFAENCTEKEYLNSKKINEPILELKKILFDTISKYVLKVIKVENQHFRHFGSLKESLSNIIALSEKFDSYVAMNSHIVNSFIGNNTVLDNVILKKDCHIGNNCIISDISFDEATVIEDNKVVCGIKTKDNQFVTIICDIDEDPKKIINSKELWDTERFYKGQSFNDSLNKFRNNSNEPTYSMCYCVENADSEYYYSRHRYINELTTAVRNDKYLKIREKVLETYFKHRTNLSYLNFNCDKVVVNLPLRINMSGTWTDAMPYCIDNGGQVINMAITVNQKKPITVTIEKLSEKRIEFCNDGIINVFTFKNYDTVETDLSDFNLHRAVLKTIGITKDTIIADGFRLTTEVSDIDKGSGLGTSSILLAGCIKAFSKIFGLKYNNSEILNMVFVAEQIMGTGGGWQDQVGGLLPYIKVCTTLPGIEQNLHIEYIDLPDSFRKIFSERLVIIPTGQRHFGRFIVNDVADRYLSGNHDSLFGHKEIRNLNDCLINSFHQENYKTFCYCINRHFELLKFISPLVSNQKIDNMINDCLAHIADAISVCGAGAGGYLFAVLKENITIKQSQDFISKNYPHINSQVKQIQLLTET